MNYYELTFTYTSAIEPEIIHDILAAELGEIGFESFTQKEDHLLAYIAEKSFNPEALSEKLADFPLPDVDIQYSEQLIIEKNWNEEWEKNYFKPIRIGQECIIRASFHEAEEGFTYNIIIDPKMAFGTGNHETTYLMLSEILQADIKGKTVLDMGCGTAVLAILAQLRGAENVTAIDIDKWAYNNALENIRLNNTEDINVILGEAKDIPDMEYDIVLANINRNILLNDIKQYVPHIKPDGLLLMSGFYETDIPAIEEECKRYGFSITSIANKNNWVAVKAQREKH